MITLFCEYIALENRQINQMSKITNMYSNLFQKAIFMTMLIINSHVIYRATDTCSKDPIISVVLVARFRTGLTIRAGLDMRNSPGYCPLVRAGTRPISRVGGT